MYLSYLFKLKMKAKADYSCVRNPIEKKNFIEAKKTAYG